MASFDDSSNDSESGFNEEYESLSDHDIANINPFATSTTARKSTTPTLEKQKRPLVETVSSPSSTSTSPNLVDRMASSPLVLSPTPSVSTINLHRASSFSPFDPLAAAAQGSSTTTFPAGTGAISPTITEQRSKSLFDDSSEHSQSRHTSSRPVSKAETTTASVTRHTTTATTLQQEHNNVRMMSQQHPNALATAGMASYLEMEEEPLRYRHAEAEQVLVPGHAQEVLEEQEDMIDFTEAEEPIQTNTGLLLTHRRTVAENRAKQRPSGHNNNHGFPPNYRPSGVSTRFEVESASNSNTLWGYSSNLGSRGLGGSGGADPYGFGRAPSTIMQARRLLSLAKVWVIFFCVVLVLGTAVMLHAFRHEDVNYDKSATQKEQQQYYTGDQQETPQQIVLLPLENAAELARRQREAEKAQQQQEQHQQRRGGRRLLSHLSDLRHEFEEWVDKHGKVYHSEHEKEKRFGIWRDNHFRTIEKNKKHGNCTLMNKPVFGSNHLKDLTTEEFQTQFLTGYNGPTHDGQEIKTGRRRNLQTAHSAPLMHPDNVQVTRHHSVHRRILQQWQISGSGFSISTSSCIWYDVSCWLRIIFREYLYVGTGTMEPKYDSDAYPTSFDWRDMGAVTEVKRQGDCGACWAITAVETIESAYFIGTGSLLDLSASEVISCTDSCNMCYGGWPQDGYDYVMERKGIMLANDWAYDADTLLAVSQELESGESELDSDAFASYISQTCPASQGSGSGDNKNNDDGTSRYGSIKGYGFATDRCVCYSDGSGCDCDNQNEGVAVRNLASYGPATVCLDASTWQDYEGGILTADSGCSPKFLAMNHCVQVVGKYSYFFRQRPMLKRWPLTFSG